MRTPKKYSDLLKRKELTNAIIAECIYSVNKRAKNYRDKIKEYKNARYHLHQQNNIENAEENMEKYYDMKEKLLSKYKPTMIHKQFIEEKNNESIVMKKIMKSYITKKEML